MRYSSKHKAETRERIIGEASRRFRKDGVDGTGLVPLMKALGLTHGGFYAHFPSKEALVEASLDAAVEEVLGRWPEQMDAEGLKTFVASYLSTRHRDNPGDGCPLPSLSAELGLRGRAKPATDMMVARMRARLKDCEIEAQPEDRGLVALAALVGAMTLARAVSDPAASERILGAVQAALKPALDSAPEPVQG